MLMNVPKLNADYRKDKDEKLFEARDSVLIEQLNKDFPRNNPDIDKLVKKIKEKNGFTHNCVDGKFE